MTEHTLKQFDIDLDRIRRGVLQMGGMVEAQFTKALEGLRSGDMASIEAAIEADKSVNLEQIRLDDACTHIIAKHQPTASDLRLLLTVIKAVSDLERVGDEAKKIAKAARRLHANGTTSPPKVGLSHAAQLALEMLRSALDGFARGDAGEIDAIRLKDAEVDSDFKGITRQLITYMVEDPRTITSSLELLFIAKAIERIGDHALNIAEHVVYMVSGEDVRFTKAQASGINGTEARP